MSNRNEPMIYRFTIPGRLPGLNEYIEAERSHRMKAATLKSQAERLIMHSIRAELGRTTITAPVFIDYWFFEKDRRRDKDNISGYAHKVIQDGLVKAKVLRNDGWREIAGFRDHFEVDVKKPRIEVTLTEVDDANGSKGRIKKGDGAQQGC